MNEQFTNGLHRGLAPSSIPSPDRTRKRRPAARPALMPYSDGTSLYLGGLTGRAPLTREDELQLARRIEQGERAMLRALLTSRTALRELAALGRDLQEGRLRAQDILRSADEEAQDREET